MKWLYGLLLSLSTLGASAGELHLFADEHPPLQFEQHGELTGFGVDLVHTLATRAGDPVQLQRTPLRRALLLAAQSPDSGAFLILRSPEREARYQWVGPAFDVQIGLYVLADRPRALSDLEQARHAGRIAVPRKWQVYAYLQRQGLDNLYGVESPEQMMHLLKVGRADLVVADDRTVAVLAREAGIDPRRLHLSLPLLHEGVYIAFSPQTDAQRVARWQAALEELRRDGRLQRLARRWQVDQAWR